MGLILGSSTSVGSLLFDGSDQVSYDRVNIPLDGTTANFGNTDFSLELWARPTASNNNTGTVSQDGNILIDRDNFTGGTSGQYIVAIRNNVFTFGVVEDTGDYTEFSTDSAVNDSAWHHLLISRDESTGDVNIYVDGTREVDSTGPAGDIRWISGGNAEDQRMVLGVEKHSFADRSFFGHMTELRVRDIYIDTASITVPTSRIGSDADTLIYYDFSEGSGTTLTDLGPNGDADGTVVFNAGNPPPTWSTLNPY